MIRQAIASLTVMAIYSVAVLGTLAAGHHAVTVLLVATFAAVAVSYMHDRICWHLSPFCVYALFTRHGDMIYIGSTNDVLRRSYEHVEDIESEPWRRDIHGAWVLRACQSERQARRIEERRIKAAVAAKKSNRMLEVHNDIHTRIPTNLLVRGWFWVWVAVYLVEQILRPSLRWIANEHARQIPPRPDSDTFDDDPEPVDPDDTATPRHRRQAMFEATYDRSQRANLDPDAGSGHAVVLWTPQASRKSRSHADPSGYATGPETRDQRDTAAPTRTAGVTLADRIRQAHENQANATRTRQSNGRSRKPSKAPRPEVTDEEREQRRREQAAERKRRQRARQRDHDQT